MNNTADEIEVLRDTLAEHAQRLENVEKGQKSMNDKLEKIDDKQDRVFDKIDSHTNSINDLRTNLPQMLMDSVEANAKRTQEIVTTHQVVCTNAMDKKFVMMPEGWKGKLVQLLIIGLAILFGFDATSLLMGKEPELKSKIENVMTIQDQSGNVYKLIPDNSKK